MQHAKLRLAPGRAGCVLLAQWFHHGRANRAPANGLNGPPASRSDHGCQGRRPRLRTCVNQTAGAPLERDPEKWIPVFGQDHAQTKNSRP